MNISESIQIALRGLGANKMRSILTMLGIIIGVGAVITLLSVGQGVEKLVTGSLQGIGSNLLFVAPGNLDALGSGTRTSRRSELTIRDADEMADPFNVPDAVGIAPEVQKNVDVEFGKTVLRTTMSGVTPEYSWVRNFKVAEGEFITPEQLGGGSRVALLGHRLATRLFPEGVYPLGQTIKIDRLPFKVVGIMEEKGGSGFGSEDDLVIVPLTTAQKRLMPLYRSNAGVPLVSIVYVQVISEDRMNVATEQITQLLRSRHRLDFDEEDDFTVINQADLIQIFGQITGVLTIFLGIIAGISLLVGGIGIMNIMLVSVTERTREIGIRKAVGAKRSDILMQFLIEAMVLSLMGGAIGIVLGVAGSAVVSNLAEDLTTVVTAQSILLATGFSAAVGLFFGIYPATRAARLHPIEALRYE